MATTLANSFAVRVTVYGDAITDVTMGSTPYRAAAVTHVVAVKAFKFNGRCTRLPYPVWIPVYSAGDPVVEGECGFHVGDALKWTIDANEVGLAITPTSGTILDMLDEASTRGLSGGVDIENIRFSGGQVCADLVVWAKIKIGPRERSFEERIGICLGLGGGCATKDINSWAKVELCYNLPSEICAKLSVDIWGYSDSWKKCTGVYISDVCAPNPTCTPASKTPTTCGCSA